MTFDLSFPRLLDGLGGLLQSRALLPDPLQPEPEPLCPGPEGRGGGCHRLPRTILHWAVHREGREHYLQTGPQEGNAFTHLPMDVRLCNECIIYGMCVKVYWVTFLMVVDSNTISVQLHLIAKYNLIWVVLYKVYIFQHTQLSPKHLNSHHMCCFIQLYVSTTFQNPSLCDNTSGRVRPPPCSKMDRSAPSRLPFQNQNQNQVYCQVVLYRQGMCLCELVHNIEHWHMIPTINSFPGLAPPTACEVTSGGRFKKGYWW